MAQAQARTQEESTDAAESGESFSNRPVANIRVGSVQASIWRNQTDGGAAFYSTTFKRSYKDKDDKWKDSDSYGPTDVLELVKAADLAHTKVIELQQQGRAR